MAKVNVIKPTGGNDNLGVVSAFNAEGNQYVILDSEKTGSMGLPIIFVSKLVGGKLERISDTNEWQSVKNYLKGIINGTNFQYIKVGDSLNADEAYYTPLTLPQASFDLIKQRYVVKEDTSEGGAPQTLEMPSTMIAEETLEEEGPALNEATMAPQEVMPSKLGAIENIGSVPSEVQVAPQPTQASSIEVPTNDTPVMPTPPATDNVSQVASPQPIQEQEQQPQVVLPVSDVAQVMPTATPASNETVSSAPVAPQVTETPAPAQDSTPALVEAVQESEAPMVITSFTSDKETFLKACENMFDALMSKYQKQLADLDRREQEINRKEQEIEQKMQNASEHLANAAAREQVANIAHDNAQKVMDLSNLMPVNPEANPTGVI